MITEVLALGALGLYAGVIEPRMLRVRRERVSLPGLRRPLLAAVIADLQPWRMHWSGPRLDALFDRIAMEAPDIALWLGDYYNAPTKGLAKALRRTRMSDFYAMQQVPMARIAAAMSRLRTPMGGYAVLGNHDWAWSGDAVAEALRGAGVRPLIGEAALARHPVHGATLSIAGLDDASSHRPTRAEDLLPLEEPAILLTHAPDVWDGLDAPALTLAGHSHGGQIAPPLVGPLRRTELGARHLRGWSTRPGAALFVSSGLGCSGMPLRLGVVPEIVLLELSPLANEMSRAILPPSAC